MGVHECSLKWMTALKACYAIRLPIIPLHGSCDMLSLYANIGRVVQDRHR